VTIGVRVLLSTNLIVSSVGSNFRYFVKRLKYNSIHEVIYLEVSD